MAWCGRAGCWLASPCQWPACWCAYPWAGGRARVLVPSPCPGEPAHCPPLQNHHPHPIQLTKTIMKAWHVHCNQHKPCLIDGIYFEARQVARYDHTRAATLPDSPPWSGLHQLQGYSPALAPGFFRLWETVSIPMQRLHPPLQTLHPPLQKLHTEPVPRTQPLNPSAAGYRQAASKTATHCLKSCAKVSASRKTR
jgi:hypothetical protein